MMTAKAIYLEDIEIGDELPAQRQRVTLERVLAFLNSYPNPSMADRPNRFNNVEQAKKEGLPGPIVPGVMSMALISTMLTDWSPTVRFKMMDAIFRQVVPQGTEVKVYGVVTDKSEERQEGEGDLYVEPLDGQPFIRGKAVVGVPSRGG